MFFVVRSVLIITPFEYLCGTDVLIRVS